MTVFHIVNQSKLFFKFADDTTLISLKTNRTIEGRCLHCLNRVVLNYMKLNVLKQRKWCFISNGGKMLSRH